MACPHCITWFTEGHSLCPVCRGQREAHFEERRRAPRRVAVSPRAQRLVARRVYPPPAVADEAPLSRRAVETRRPHRREVFRLTGQYFPEPVAAGATSGPSATRKTRTGPPSATGSTASSTPGATTWRGRPAAPAENPGPPPFRKPPRGPINRGRAPLPGSGCPLRPRPALSLFPHAARVAPR